MPDIFHNLLIKGPRAEVFRMISTPAGLDSWWTKTCTGEPVPGAEYSLGFGPEYDWQARVVRCIPDREFEFEFVRADNDWQGTRLAFLLTESDAGTEVTFRHLNWPEANEHYRISCYCWAMYLRLMKRCVEYGEVVPYEDRLEV